MGNFINEENFGMSESEKIYRENVRRDVVAKKEIIQGDTLNTQNISLKRTAKTNTIKHLELVLGKIAKKAIQKNKPVLTKDIK
jgi:N,N'-diacetyllegionaminate synthase